MIYIPENVPPGLVEEASVMTSGHVLRVFHPTRPDVEIDGAITISGARHRRDAFARILLGEVRPGYRDNLRYVTEERLKFAGHTSNLAHEILTFDRTDQQETVKEHRVRERRPDGVWTLEHEEVVRFPARHRP